MIETNLPILYLREVVLLPFNEIRLEFTEDKEKNILENDIYKYKAIRLFNAMIEFGDIDIPINKESLS